jgi:hypothetical protein
VSTRTVGDRVGLEHLVYNDAGVLTNATVVLTVTDPLGADTTPSVTHASTGTYTADFDLTSAGVWLWRWTVSGAVIDVDDGQVTAVDPAPPTYASLSLLKLALGLSPTDTTRDEILTLALNGASRSVEQYCDGRVFTLAPTATARVFPAGRRVICTDQGERLDVDDIGALDDLLVEVGDGTTWTTVTNVETYPDNALAKLQAITAVGSWTTCLRWQRKMRVTARWGWPEVPTAVEQATLLQATRLAKRPGSPEGVAGSADWGLVRIPNLDPDVKALLAYLTSVPVA